MWRSFDLFNNFLKINLFLINFYMRHWMITTAEVTYHFLLFIIEGPLCTDTLQYADFGRLILPHNHFKVTIVGLDSTPKFLYDY